MVDLNTGRIWCPVYRACIGCATHLGPCALKVWARALQSVALVFAAEVLAAIEAGTDVPKPVEAEDVATKAAPAGQWAEPVLEESAERAVPPPTSRFGKAPVVAGPAPAAAELGG